MDSLEQMKKMKRRMDGLANIIAKYGGYGQEDPLAPIGSLRRSQAISKYLLKVQQRADDLESASETDHPGQGAVYQEPTSEPTSSEPTSSEPTSSEPTSSEPTSEPISYEKLHAGVAEIAVYSGHRGREKYFLNGCFMVMVKEAIESVISQESVSQESVSRDVAMSWTSEAVKVLQDSAEHHLIEVFKQR